MYHRGNLELQKSINPQHKLKVKNNMELIFTKLNTDEKNKSVFTTYHDECTICQIPKKYDVLTST